MHELDSGESGPEPMDYSELHEEINRLPEKYRLPIIICYMQGKTQTQAARTLGWPLGTVQIRLHRGRERLRSRLTRRGAGLIALTGSDLTTSLSSTPGAFGRRVDRDDRARRRPVCRRQRDGRAGRAACVRTGRDGARGHAWRILEAHSL